MLKNIIKKNILILNVDLPKVGFTKSYQDKTVKSKTRDENQSHPRIQHS